MHTKTRAWLVKFHFASGQFTGLVPKYVLVILIYGTMPPKTTRLYGSTHESRVAGSIRHPGTPAGDDPKGRDATSASQLRFVSRKGTPCEHFERAELRALAACWRTADNDRPRSDTPTRVAIVDSKVENYSIYVHMPVTCEGMVSVEGAARLLGIGGHPSTPDHRGELVAYRIGRCTGSAWRTSPLSRYGPREARRLITWSWNARGGEPLQAGLRWLGARSRSPIRQSGARRH